MERVSTFIPALSLTLLATVASVFTATAWAGGSKATPAPVPQTIEMKAQPPFWTKKANLISYRCKDLHLQVRSKVSPSVEYKLSDGLFNEKDCKETIAQIEEKGCFCDDAELKCIETERIEPMGIVCPGLFMCFVWRGQKTGVLKVVTLDNHITRQKCVQEFKDLDRVTEDSAGSN